jgi:hypothetical protein
MVPVRDPATLSELAHLLRRREAAERPIAQLGAEKLDELCEMISRGDVPTIGWWRRALRTDERQLFGDPATPSRPSL